MPPDPLASRAPGARVPPTYITLAMALKERWNWYMQFHRHDSHFNRFFHTFITQVLAEVSYLVVCISWSFYGCLICCLRQPWKYYENTNSEKMRILLAGYTFIGFALLYFQTLTSCPLRGLFSIGWENVKQLSLLYLRIIIIIIKIINLALQNSQSLQITILNSNNMQYKTLWNYNRFLKKKKQEKLHCRIMLVFFLSIHNK